jgi:hypothetical protein
VETVQKVRTDCCGRSVVVAANRAKPWDSCVFFCPCFFRLSFSLSFFVAGSYDGQAVAMVIRDMVQLASTKEEAVAIAKAAKRTWSVWLGFGDDTSQEFIAMLYDQAGAVSYDDKTLPVLTNQTAFTDVAYIDKHPQPSTHPDMPALVKQYYGNLTADNVAQNIPRGMQSGDVHVAVYDFANKKVMFATGTTDGPAGPYTRLACNAPFLRFDTEELWNEPKPL